MRTTKENEIVENSPSVVALQGKFPTFSEFAMRVNPDIQHRIISHGMGIVDCARKAEAPTLATIRATYGEDSAELWLSIQFEQLNAYAENGRGLTELQMKELTTLVLGEYYYLNVYEISLFLVKVKLGKYGEFFGAVGPMKIMTSLNKYIQERRMALETAEYYEQQERLDRERQEAKKNAITYEQYLRMKKAGEIETLSQNSGHTINGKGGSDADHTV